LGGSFKEGAFAGFASGLATVVSDNILKGISTSGSAMSPADIAAARTLARVVGSAIRAVASPDDQLSAFGSSLLGDLLNDMKTDPATGSSPTAGSDTGAAPGGSQDADPPFRVDWDLGPGSSGLRLTTDNVAQFQADLQSGIERASAQPDLDPAAYAQQRFANLRPFADAPAAATQPIKPIKPSVRRFKELLVLGRTFECAR
jgi:hypothetical protein